MAAGEGLATLISVAEQPSLAIADALIVASDEYKAFINFLELSEEERNQLLDLLPDDLADRIRSVAKDIEEVFSRVGTGFDADLFRALPLQIQGILEDAFDRYNEINPTLEAIFEEAKNIVEDGSITIAERARRVTRFLANDLGEPVIQLAQSGANILNFLTSGADELGGSFGILKEIAGGLGEILGLGRERTIAFADGLDTLINAGESTLILQERITQSLGLSTIGVALGFNRLLTSAENIEEAFGQAAFTSIRLSAAWREANFVAGEFTGNTSNLNEALNLTTLGLEDAAVAFGSLVTSGAGLGTLVAPGVGLLFESVNNVIESATDYVAISRLVSTLPTWFSQGDITSIQKAFRELDKFTTASNAAREEIALGFDIELPEIGILAEEAQEVLNVLTTLQPFLVSGAFDEFLKLQGFPDLFPDEDLTRGEQFFRILQAVASGAELTAEQLEYAQAAMESFGQATTKSAPEFFNQVLQNNITAAREFSSTLSILSETISNNARVEVQELRNQLDEIRDIRLAAEEEVNTQLERDLEITREKLNNDLISLEQYFNDVAAFRDTADVERAEATKKEIALLNKIQEKEYEAQLNAFNINKAVRLADIAINAAASFAASVGTIGFLGIPLGTIVQAAAAAQAALVFSQKAPPPPPAITALQTGGVVNRPTRALIGEAGPEAVIPLDEYDFNRRDNNGSTTIVINVNGSLVHQDDLADFLEGVSNRAKRRKRVRSL